MIDYRQGISLFGTLCLSGLVLLELTASMRSLDFVEYSIPSATPPNIAASYSDGFLRVFDFGRERDGLSAMVRIALFELVSWYSFVI